MSVGGVAGEGEGGSVDGNAGGGAFGNRNRRSDPRHMGLLSPVDPAARERPNRSFPYGLGDRIAGDLTVIGHLAAGRVGHLYQVWSAGDWCAYTCKILDPALGESKGAGAALRREGKILRKLNHPHVVQSYGSGEHDGFPFLLLEYLAGPSIFDVLEAREERRLPVEDAIRVALHGGAGLYHLHGRGLMHLDVKPANLLLRGAVPVLVDFDVAKPISPARRPRRPLGTSPYMAPEHVRCEPLTPAVDIYGLGAVLYELLTGRWPFEDVYTGRETRTGEEREYPQLGDAPPPGPRTFNETISHSLDALVQRCLAADPNDRFPSLHPVLVALAAELEGPGALWPTGVETERRQSPRD